MCSRGWDIPNQHWSSQPSKDSSSHANLGILIRRRLFNKFDRLDCHSFIHPTPNCKRIRHLSITSIQEAGCNFSCPATCHHKFTGCLGHGSTMTWLTSPTTHQSLLTTLQYFPSIWCSPFGQLIVGNAYLSNNLECG